MKTRVGRLAAFALAVLTIGVLAGRAQILNQLDFKMKQPFTVGNATLAAGSYVIRPVSGADQMVVEISAAGGKPTILVEVEALQPDAVKGSHLVFNKYKSLLALSQVFPGGGQQGYQVLQGHPEKMAAKSEQPTKQTVTSSSK
jgi:hypothetical protein